MRDVCEVYYNVDEISRAQKEIMAQMESFRLWEQSGSVSSLKGRVNIETRK